MLQSLFQFNPASFWEYLFAIQYIPKLDNEAGYGLLLLFGVLSSFHCLGMCGGIVLSQCIGDPETTAGHPGNQSPAWLVPSSLYNAGRVISYTLIGGIAGGLGQMIGFSGVWRGIVPIIGGLFMIIMALNLLDVFPVLRRFNIHMPLFFAKKIKGGNHFSPFYIGLMSGFMPCGPLQIVQLYALGTGSVLHGALAMFIFVIATVPTLFILGTVNMMISKKRLTVILKASALLVLVLAITMIGRGLALSGVSVSSPIINTAGSQPNVAKIQGNMQTISTEILSDRYPVITVQKGIPVEWMLIADSDKLNNCNNKIIIAKFNLEKALTAGENQIEFTPLEEGEIPYSCWMGMIKSKIIVVNKL